MAGISNTDTDGWIRRMAIGEVLNPTFELTKQYLAVNRLVCADGEPVIEDVIVNEDGAEVYFAVDGERYYFAIYLDLSPEGIPSLRWMGTSAGNTVELQVASEDIPLSDLLTLVDITPTREWDKGQLKPPPYQPGSVYKFSSFLYTPTPKRTGDVEEKLRALVEVLMPQRDRVRRLNEVATAGITVGYSGYVSDMLGFYFGPELLSAIGELNLSLDLDLYAGDSGLLDPYENDV